MTATPFWSAPVGRELDATPLAPWRPARIVACLNVWNDLAALRQTLPTWRGFVDTVIAVDGAYRGVEVAHDLSTDGTRNFLLDAGARIIDAGGLSQCEKRTKYLEAGQPGDLLFVVDADEMVENADAIRKIGWCDVGWVRVASNLYARTYGQPRLFRWRPFLRYEGRHHWIFAGDRLLSTHQYSGPGFANTTVPTTLRNHRLLGRSSERLAAKATHHRGQFREEVRQVALPPFSAKSDASASGRESLQIVHMAYRDDGLAPGRLHTAINRTTPHASIFFKTRPGPFNVPSQYLAKDNPLRITNAMGSADVLHYHGMMSAARTKHRTGLMVVHHHHGTLYRRNAAKYNMQARQQGALVLLSNLELFSWVGTTPAYFLPNAMPVARYEELADGPWWDGSSPFRVAHSPSHPSRKGTTEFLAVADAMRRKGYPIEPVILTNMAHAEVLKTKATCHAAFDSFWLGMQCSGLEAAAMRMPVIAGDPIVSKRYIDTFGDIPYTYANDAEQLEAELTRLMEDETYRIGEIQRVFEYVRTYHDEAAVSLKYLDLLDQAFGWRSRASAKPRPTARKARPLARRAP